MLALKEKITKAHADYRQRTSQKRCGVCSMYHPPTVKQLNGSCDLVEGAILSYYVCKYFEPKK